jgi:hypothetical protein
MARVAITADNSHVFFNQGGLVSAMDTASGLLHYASIDPNCCYGDWDLTLSANQTTLEASSYLYDRDLNASAYLTLNDREWTDADVYGTKLSPDGALLFQPTTNGIDVYDARVGTFRTRIALPVSLSQNFDALVSDGKDNILIAITGQTGTGIAIVDLSSLPEPPPLAYPSDANLGGRTAPAPRFARASALRLRSQSISHITHGVQSPLPRSTVLPAAR